MRNGSKDAKVDRLAQALAALGVDVRNVENRFDVQDKKMIEVLSNLQNFPWPVSSQGAIDMTQMRAGLEEGQDIIEALKLDTVDELMEVVRRTFLV